jgi:hypothetical protein
VAEEPWEPSDAFGDGRRSGGFFGCVGAVAGLFMIALGGTCAWMGLSGQSAVIAVIGLAMMGSGFLALTRR